MTISLSRHLLPIALLLCALVSSANTYATDLTVNIKGARTDKGVVIVTLHNKKDGFPGKNAISEKKMKIKKGKAKVVFKDVKPGEYAVALVHDEDGDGKMKTSLIGIPKEGFGTSKNVKPKFGPPKYSAAKFDLTEEAKALSITVLYF